MTSHSPAAVSAREAARRKNGEFGEQVKNDPGDILGGVEPMMVTARLQVWQRDYAVEVETVEFDAADILKNLPPERRDNVLHGYGDLDWLLYEAQSRGLVKEWDGPFDVDVEDDELEQWFDRNPYVAEDPDAPVQRAVNAAMQRIMGAFGELNDDARRQVIEQLYADEKFQAEIIAAQKAAGE